MHVKMIGITKPMPTVLGDPPMSAEELLVYIARVSSPDNQDNLKTAPQLLRYLIKNKHWSPFDMANLIVEVKTSKAIAIQILRHWSIKPQEFSQRYAEVTEIEQFHLRKKAEKNRQSSTDRFDPMVPDDFGLFGGMPVRASEMNDKICSIIMMHYQNMLKADVAKECARMILPMATSTVLYLNGSIRSWIHYLQQRTDEHAQLEHQEVAAEIKRIFGQHFPNVLKALEE